MEYLTALLFSITIVILVFYRLLSFTNSENSEIPYANYKSYPLVGHLFVFLQNRASLEPLITEFIRRVRQQMQQEIKMSEWNVSGMFELSHRLIFTPSAVVLFGEHLAMLSLENDFRVLDKNFHYFTGNVERGGMVAFFPGMIHMNEKFFPEPEKFIFDRFIHKNVDNITVFMPFGGGKSICPGRIFAKHEIKICLAMLLRYVDYKFIDTEHIPTHKPIRIGFI